MKPIRINEIANISFSDLTQAAKDRITATLKFPAGKEIDSSSAMVIHSEYTYKDIPRTQSNVKELCWAIWNSFHPQVSDEFNNIKRYMHYQKFNSDTLFWEPKAVSENMLNIQIAAKDEIIRIFNKWEDDISNNTGEDDLSDSFCMYFEMITLIGHFFPDTTDSFIANLSVTKSISAYLKMTDTIKNAINKIIDNYAEIRQTLKKQYKLTDIIERFDLTQYKMYARKAKSLCESFINSELKALYDAWPWESENYSLDAAISYEVIMTLRRIRLSIQNDTILNITRDSNLSWRFSDKLDALMFIPDADEDACHNIYDDDDDDDDEYEEDDDDDDDENEDDDSIPHLDLYANLLGNRNICDEGCGNCPEEKNCLEGK